MTFEQIKDREEMLNKQINAMLNRHQIELATLQGQVNSIMGSTVSDYLHENLPGFRVGGYIESNFGTTRISGEVVEWSYDGVNIRGVVRLKVLLYTEGDTNELYLPTDRINVLS